MITASVVAGWGLLGSRAGEPGPQPRRGAVRLGGGSRRDRVFTQLAALVQTLVLLCGAMGLTLLAGPGGGPDDSLHTSIYGPFMVAALIGAWTYRTADRRWNVRVFAVACIFVAGLGVRAFFTG